jgi:hypothetical protein
MIEPLAPAAPTVTELRLEAAAAIRAGVASNVNVADQAVRSIGLPAVVLTPGVPYAVEAVEARPFLVAAGAAGNKTVRLVAWIMVGREIDRPLDLIEAIAEEVRTAIATIPGAADDGITAAGDVEPLSGVPYMAARVDFRMSR